MPYEFFFSYSRGNFSNYLKRFFDDLVTELRDQLERNNTADPIGFLDQSDIELGDEWEQTILGALQESKVLLSIYTPAYFQSPYCGKEWRFFHMRREAARVAALKTGKLGKLPPTIKPVLWMGPLPSNLPPEVKAAQYTSGPQMDVQNREGLAYVLKKRAEYKSLYQDYIIDLAKQIKEAIAAHPMPRLDPPPSLKAMDSMFHAAAGAAPVMVSSSSEAASTRHVRFVFVAGNPAEFQGVRCETPYLDAGAGDWRPFYPQATTRIRPLVQNFVSTEEMDFDSDVLPLDANLRSEIMKAYQERKIVVILVDAWTVNWKAEYKKILEELDRKLEAEVINWSVLVPWNSMDAEIEAQRSTLEDTLKDTFYIRANFWKNPLFFRHSIGSVDELKEALREVLTQLRTEMHNRAQRTKPIPTDITKPVVNNQSAQGGAA